MRAIQSKNTRPELAIRKALHGLGFRYRLHVRELPGKPDLVLPKHQAVIFVHGCFWHRHDCAAFKMPTQRREFWETKIGGNVTRDAASEAKLAVMGWRIATIWECALRGRGRLSIEEVATELSRWLQEGGQTLVIRAKS